jgi:hypothetical protein
MVKHEWQMFRASVSASPATMADRLAVTLTEVEDEGWEVFTILTSPTAPYGFVIVGRRPRPEAVPA